MTVDYADFLAAQADDFPRAMAELRSGEKRSHWIWYVFPQLAGLRVSTTAVRYGLENPDDARDYLRHPILGARLSEAVEVVHDQICGRGAWVEHLMGSEIDAMKLVSCLTLFAPLATELAETDATGPWRALAARAEAVLAVAATQAFPRCAFTMDALALSAGGR